MASLEIIDEANFRRKCSGMDEPELVSQLLIQQGALHALLFLQRRGVTPQRVADMLDQIERNAGIVSQIAASKGIELNITIDDKFT